MDFSLFLLGAMFGAFVGGAVVRFMIMDEKDELMDLTEQLMEENERLLRLNKDSYDVIVMQKQYINQIDKPYLRREEGVKCDPFTKF